MTALIVREKLEVKPNDAESYYFVLEDVTPTSYQIERTNHGGYGDNFKVKIVKSEIPPMVKAITSGLYVFCGAFYDNIRPHPEGEVDLELAKKCIGIANDLMTIESRYEAQSQMLDKLDILLLGVSYNK